MPRARKPWSKTIEAAGVSVRIYERAIGSVLYREVRLGNGAKDRQSLKHRDRALAERQAKELALRLGELRLVGQVSGLTFGQLRAIYERDRFPLLKEERQRAVRGMLALLERHFTRDFRIDDLSQHHVDGYVAARRSGALVSPRHRMPEAGVRAGTIRNELHALQTLIRWAQGHRINGRRLLTSDPSVGLTIPAEKNPRRPVATEERYRALLAVAGEVDPTGRFRLTLALARHTGRRINAICQLRASDVLLSREQMLRALGAAGMDLAFADAWPHGAIRWGEATDKLGFEAIAPLSREARAELDAYLVRSPRLGDAPLLPQTSQPAKAVHKAHASWWLRRATKKAKLPPLERGGYHVFRRAWASARRHLPAQDVAAAGGWRSIQVMRDAYQRADPATVYSVVDLEARDTESRATGPTQDSPPSERVAR